VTNVTDATSWVRAVRASHDRLAGLVAGLDGDGLRAQSYDTEWSVADVLSHLGSGAEISALYLEAGVTGGEPPEMDAFKPIWDTWNARSPEEQAAQSVIANEAFVTRVESLTVEERAAFSVTMFGRMSVDLAGALGMRLSEHALHTWDVAAASPISAADVAMAAPVAEAELAVGFFGSRYDRATPAEREYMHAMAELGGPNGAAVATSEVAVSLGRKPASLSPARDSLIKKGLVYSAERGSIAFTVPHFGRYLLRHPD